LTLHSGYCPGCSGTKAVESKLCEDCGDIYGGYADWPAWLRFRYNDIRREAAHDQAANDVEYYDEDAQYQCVDDNLMTRPSAEMARSERPTGDPWWADGGGAVTLPVSPYDDEEMNRQYREANGIVLAGR